MASADTKLVINNAALDGLLHGANGPVYVDMLRRAQILQSAAKMQIRTGTGPSGPGGHLKDSVVKRVEPNGTGNVLMTVWVGSNHPRAYMYHEGTGPHEIRSRTDKPMHFMMNGMDVFAMAVQHPGTAPNHYLTDNLPLVVN